MSHWFDEYLFQGFDKAESWTLLLFHCMGLVVTHNSHLQLTLTQVALLSLLQCI